MVIKELNLVAKLAMKAASMTGITKSDVEKNLKPLINSFTPVSWRFSRCLR